MGVEVGVDLRLKRLDKPKTLCEVGVLQQVDKVRMTQGAS